MRLRPLLLRRRLAAAPVPTEPVAHVVVLPPRPPAPDRSAAVRPDSPD